jgi:hypothetical protein
VTDLAALTRGIDAAPAVAGARALDDLAGASDRAERGVIRLGSASSTTQHLTSSLTQTATAATTAQRSIEGLAQASSRLGSSSGTARMDRVSLHRSSQPGERSWISPSSTLPPTPSAAPPCSC